MAWNRPSENGEAVSRPLQKRSGDRFPLKGTIIGAVVVLGAVVAAWWFWPTGENAGETPPSKTQRRIREVTSAPAPKAESVSVEKADVAKKKRKVWKTSDGFWHYYDRNGEENLTKNRLEIAAMMSETPGVQNPALMRSESDPPPRYKNVLQGEIVQFLHPGKLVRLSRNYTDEEAIKMAETAIEYGFDEPYEVLEEKKAVEDTCKELLDYVKQGGHAQEYLQKLLDRQTLEHEAVQTTRDNVEKLCREGDPDGARAALKAYNEYLTEKGLPTVNMESEIDFWVDFGREEREGGDNK